MENILVTGGAGYIGSHACKALMKAGYNPITFDNLKTGWRDSVKFGPFVNGDLLTKSDIDNVFETYSPLAVMHFAALSQVAESVLLPDLYWRNNVLGSLNLIQSAVEHGCKNIVFSSTCAVYGDQDCGVMDEKTLQIPNNPYGASKRAVEDILRNYQSSFGLNYLIFRYFNVAGADSEGEIGEFHRPETHLIPLILETLDDKREALTIFGTDYETADGTCIRDYIHVCDLVDAHILGLEWLRNGKGSNVFNLGTGIGFSVKEVINHVEVFTKKKVPILYGERRLGDCTKLVSGSELANSNLGWSARRSSLEHMVKDAWRWHQSGGYEQ